MLRGRHGNGGDYISRQKCLLLVAHDESLLRRLCHRSAYLDRLSDPAEPVRNHTSFSETPRLSTTVILVSSIMTQIPRSTSLCSPPSIHVYSAPTALLSPHARFVYLAARVDVRLPCAPPQCYAAGRQGAVTNNTYCRMITSNGFSLYNPSQYGCPGTSHLSTLTVSLSRICAG